MVMSFGRYYVFDKVVNFLTDLQSSGPFRTVSDIATHTHALKYGHKIIKTDFFW